MAGSLSRAAPSSSMTQKRCEYSYSLPLASRTVRTFVRYTASVTQDGRIVAAELDGEDGDERSLRPRSLEEFPGQQRVKENISIAVQAASARGEALDHLLLYGPPGLGKTTIANIVA